MEAYRCPSALCGRARLSGGEADRFGLRSCWLGGIRTGLCRVAPRSPAVPAPEDVPVPEFPNNIQKFSGAAYDSIPFRGIKSQFWASPRFFQIPPSQLVAITPGISARWKARQSPPARRSQLTSLHHAPHQSRLRNFATRFFAFRKILFARRRFTSDWLATGYSHGLCTGRGEISR